MSLLEIRDPVSGVSPVEGSIPRKPANLVAVADMSTQILSSMGLVDPALRGRLDDQFDRLIPHLTGDMLPAVGINLQAADLHPRQLVSAFNLADPEGRRVYVDDVYTYPDLKPEDWDQRLTNDHSEIVNSPIFAMAISSPIAEGVDWHAQQRLLSDRLAHASDELAVGAFTQADWLLYNAAARLAQLPVLDDLDAGRTFTRFVQYPLRENGQGPTADVSQGEAGLGDSTAAGLPGGAFRVVYWPKQQS